MSVIGPLSRPLVQPVILPITGEVSGGSTTPFDPASLFGANDRGAVFDLTDSANLFQLSGGTTAVTTAGDPVGYADDLGPMGRNAIQATAAARPIWLGVPRTLGAELAVNGRFAADTDWTKGAGWTIVAPSAIKVAGVASSLSQAITLVAGTTYVLCYQITRSAGTITAQFTGGTTVSGVARNYFGSYIEIFTALAGNTTLEFAADATFVGTLRNVTVKPAASYTNMGAMFDGVDDRLRTAAIDATNSDKMTMVLSGRYMRTGNRTPLEFGNYLANTTGSAQFLFASNPQARLRGDTGNAVSATPNNEGPPAILDWNANVSAQLDIAQATIATEVVTRTRGVTPTQTTSGTTAGTSNFANGAITIGSPFNSGTWWLGLVNRAIVINRTLTPTELANSERWTLGDGVYAAVLGDSTVAILNSTSGMPQAVSIASLVGGMVCGAADVSDGGDRIADQKTLWTALPNKTALEVVMVQVGLNDVKGRVGEGLATTAQVIADLQDLVATINTDKPLGCKVYICGLTPCKAWLDLATNPAAAYAAWLAMNEAIAGNGATPITGVDGRVTSYVAALNDGAGNLAADYNMDDVHENNEARLIIAQAWRSALEADDLLSAP